ncbi:MAG: glutathione peroxidase [Pseudomonadota bacterium]
MRVDRRALLLGFGGLLMSGGAWAGDDGAYDGRFRFTAIEGGELAMADFAGKAVLLVNTASRCGFTPQYAALQETWERYRDRGLVVLAVPSNDFGGQEPLDEAGIKKFCEVQFGIDFPMTAKERVAGPEAHPLYRWIADTLGARGKPTWNFHKFLIDPQGQLTGAWPARVAPSEPVVTAAIEQALPR